MINGGDRYVWRDPSDGLPLESVQFGFHYRMVVAVPWPLCAISSQLKFIIEFVNLLLMKKNSFYIILCLLILLTVPGLLFAGAEKPKAVVKELLTAISLVKDESTSKLTPEERKNNKKLTQKANSFIHISILGTKTLGSYWKKRTPAEKEKFLSVLRKLFKKVAYPKSAKFFTDLEIQYNTETTKKGKAEVHTSMEHESEGLIEIDYKLHQIEGRWLIYDVILDEVSLVSNLKTQFHKIIEEESFNELINRMEKRLEKED